MSDKVFRSIIVIRSVDSKMLNSVILDKISNEYNDNVLGGTIYNNDGSVSAVWEHYHGKWDQVPGTVDIFTLPTFECSVSEYAEIIRNSYKDYNIPKWFVSKSENRREYMRQEDFMIWKENHNNIGKIVEKRSGNPFKSGLYYATVKTCERNPYSGLWGFTFEEDESIVDIKQLKLVHNYACS